jgi:hypothetical protein
MFKLPERIDFPKTIKTPANAYIHADLQVMVVDRING